MSSVRRCLPKAIALACRCNTRFAVCRKSGVRDCPTVGYEPTDVPIIKNLQDARGSVNPCRHKQGILIGPLTDRDLSCWLTQKSFVNALSYSGQ